MDEIKRGQMLEEAKRLQIAAPVLIPILEKRREYAIQKIIANFRDEKTNQQTGTIAELYTIDGILYEINTKLNYLNEKGE